MNKLKTISNLEYNHDGGYFGLIGTKNWFFKAYDEHNKLICSLDTTENEKHNYLTYVKFIQKLKNNGYKLDKNNIIEITDNTNNKNFLMKYYLKFAKKSDLYEIAALSGYSCYDVNNLKYTDEETKKKFAEDNGLQYKNVLELIKNL